MKLQTQLPLSSPTKAKFLKDSSDPDLLYNQIIRPWKSRLALAYIDRQNFWIDLRLIILTVVAIISRPRLPARLESSSTAGNSTR
jgi:lipopolysaccharide/colanic/teichoic acid biosynthesis glycosyltransferase